MPNALRELALVFARLGLFGFGGPIALMAMIQEETSRKRAWIDKDHFTRVYAILKVMPGPLSTQMAIYVGRLRAGTWGGVVAGLSFLAPSVLSVLLLSVVYLHTPWVTQASSLFTGMQIGALVLILLSTWDLFREHAKRWEAWGVVAVSAGGVLLFPIWEPLFILAFGLLGVLFFRNRKYGPKEAPAPRTEGDSQGGGALHALWVAPGFWLASASTLTLVQLFWVCFKAGAFVFGTGIAIIPILEAEVVGHFHWLTHREFMDGIALGQITPGPIVSTATFVGFKAAGFTGAFVATVGMFIPAFFNILVLMPKIWSRFADSSGAAGFAAWAIPAVIGGILGASIRMWVLTLGGLPQFFYFLVVVLFCLWRKPPSWLVIPVAGLIWSVVM